MRPHLSILLKFLGAVGLLQVLKSITMSSGPSHRLSEIGFSGIETLRQKLLNQTPGQRSLPSVSKPVKVPYVKVRGRRIYMYSAVAQVSSQSTDNYNISISQNTFKRLIYINAWRHNETLKDKLKCCYYLQNGTILTRGNSQQYIEHFRVYLKSVQLICPFPDDYKFVEGVAVALARNACPKNEEDYIVPQVYSEKKLKIAVCAKISYGALDASKLVEWLEALKLFGADKVITYSHNLNTEATRVYEHYRSEGFVDIFPFQAPETDVYPRGPENKIPQTWSDEQVAIFDCQEKMKSFQYGVFLDTDEFLVPEIGVLQNSWSIYFDMRLKYGKPGLYFLTRMHLTSWEQSDPESPLFFGRYMDRSPPLVDRSKYVYRTDAIVQGGCTAHRFKRSKKEEVDNITFVARREATVHHFRFCQQGWKHLRKDPNKINKVDKEGPIPDVFDPDFCIKLPKAPSKHMRKVIDAITDRVQRIQKVLNLRNPT